MAAPPPLCLLPVAKRPRVLCPEVPHQLSGKQPAPGQMEQSILWILGAHSAVENLA